MFTCTSNDGYHIAGNFGDTSEQSVKVFSAKILFSSNLRNLSKFSKVSRYTIISSSLHKLSKMQEYFATTICPDQQANLYDFLSVTNEPQCFFFAVSNM